ncbi:hypothetical protein PJE062_1890 [Pseudovibrio sp. JE062]|nr:hypothetical protein PJE062_1890 [Pseudovibrio sp. JE062]
MKECALCAASLICLLKQCADPINLHRKQLSILLKSEQLNSQKNGDNPCL